MNWAFALIRLVPAQAWLVAGAVALGGIWHWRETSRAYEAGKAAAIESIEKANAAAQRKAGEGEAAVIACHRAGKEWNRETGRCSD